MITLTARIDILTEENGGKLSSASSNISGNNISSPLYAVVGEKRSGRNPFILGASNLGDGSHFSNGETYYIGSVVAKAIDDDDYSKGGIFPTPYSIYVAGENITAINICFDDVNDEYPNTIRIDGQVYTNDDVNFTASVEKADSHTIVIDNWSAPNFPLRIQGIYIDLSIDIDRNNLISISRTITDRSGYELPLYGIISNTGNIEFNDIDGEVLEYAQQQLLKGGLTVEISLNNTVYKNSEHIGTYLTNKWTYDNDNRVVYVSIKNNLEEWQDINVEPIYYDPSNPKPQTAEWFYRYLQEERTVNGKKVQITPPKYNVLPFEKLDTETQNVLSNTTIQYPLLESGTLWNSYEKLCELCLLHIYVDNDGNTVTKYNGGN